MISTVLFDLDGTLLDTLEDLQSAVNHALTECGFSPRTHDEIRMFVGDGVQTLMRRALPENVTEEVFDRAFSLFRDDYSAHSRDMTAPYAGILEMLETLTEKGYRLAVISNKYDAAVKELNKTFFHGIFPVAIGEDEAAGRRKKPAPDAVFEAMRQLESRPEDCVYVGDSDTDILTAKNAGIPFIGCAWGFRGRKFLAEHGADDAAIIEKPKELVDFL